MDFFNKLGKKASKTYKITAEKTGKLAKEAKLRLKINENKSDIQDLYEQIGKKVYEKHIREENINIKEELEEECTKIDVLSAEIETLLKECLNLKDKKQCKKCFAEIEKQAQFCPKCGAKQEERTTTIVEEKQSQATESKEEEKMPLENKDLKENTIEVEEQGYEKENIDNTIEENMYEDENKQDAIEVEIIPEEDKNKSDVIKIF